MANKRSSTSRGLYLRGNIWWMHYVYVHPKTWVRGEYRLSIDKLAGRHIELKTDAATVKGDTEAAIRAGTFRTSGTSDASLLTFTDVTRLYVQSYISQAKLAGKAWEFIITDANAWFSEHHGSKPFCELTTLDYEAYLAHVAAPYRRARQRTLKPGETDTRPYRLRSVAARNKYRTRILHLCGWALDRGLLTSNPFLSKSGKPLIKEAKGAGHRHRRLPIAEERYLLMHADPDLIDWVQLAIDLGWRRREQFTLPLSAINFVTREITIPEEWLCGGEVVKPKSRRGRMIPIASDRSFEILQRMSLDVHGAPRPLTEPIVVYPDGTPVNPATAYDRLRAVARRAGVRDLVWHDLRHEYASRLYYDCRVALQVVQLALGHASILMTSRYLNVKQEGIKEACARLQVFYNTMAAQAA